MSERGWALVTGAARRIGRTLALAAAKAGYDVIIHARAETALGDVAETAAQVESLGRRATVELFDLTWRERPLVFERDDEPVRLLVNCASVFEDDRIETMTAESFDLAIGANLRGPLLLAQAFAAALPEGQDGLIVNIIDQRVLRLTPQFFSYTLSRAALWTATQTLAQALAPRIRVNAIAPGPTLRSIHQTESEFAAESQAVLLQRGPAPEELGAALAYLIDAASVTGQMIAVDGGQHLAWKTPDIIGD